MTRNARRAMWIALGLASWACHSFEIPTKPDFGFVRVSITTSGGDLDTDGYSVLLDNSQFKLVKATATESFYVPSGEHSVSITNLAENCAVTGPASQTVTVDQGQVASVTFEVVCVPTGIVLTTRTTGPDSPDNLRIVVNNGPGSSRRTARGPSVASRQATIGSR